MGVDTVAIDLTTLVAWWHINMHWLVSDALWCMLMKTFNVPNQDQWRNSKFHSALVPFCFIFKTGSFVAQAVSGSLCFWGWHCTVCLPMLCWGYSHGPLSPALFCLFWGRILTCIPCCPQTSWVLGLWECTKPGLLCFRMHPPPAPSSEQ